MKVYIGPFPDDGNIAQEISVQIDPWDTWGIDITLAHIIIPMLKQLQATKHGSPSVDDADVPEHLGIRRCDAPAVEAWDIDEHWHKRWDYVLSAILWSFEEILTDWEEAYWIIPYSEDGKGLMDMEGIRAHGERIQEGFRLFGKHFRNLWD